MQNRKQTMMVWFGSRMTVLWFAIVTVVVGGALPGFIPAARAQVTAAWNQDADGNWSAGANWTAGNAPTGTAGVAYFTNAITASRTVLVDASPWTIGGLTFSDSDAYGFTITNGTLNALASIVVNSNSVATVASSISGTANLTKTGAGTLVLSGLNNYSGRTYLNAGTTVIDGATISNSGAFDIGAVSSPSVFIFNAGAITAASQFVIGAHGTSSGVQSNGTLQVNGTFYMGGYAEGPGTGTYTQVGGTVTVTTGMDFGGGGPNSGIYTLSGGSLTVAGLAKNGTGANTFNFNGGVLKPRASSGTFMQGLTTANVQLGGALLDTAGFNITIAQPLLHEPSLGGTPDGGLTKLGTGVLTLTGANTYTGPTAVSNGILAVKALLAGYDQPGKITVAPGAGLSVDAGSWNTSQVDTLLSNATLGSGSFFGFGGQSGYSSYTGSLTLGNNMGLLKTGPNVVTLSGSNSYPGGTVVLGGILQADFGTGISSTTNVTLTAASLSSISGSITAALGTGAGQITLTPGTASGFSAVNTPLIVNLGGAGAPLSWGSSTFNPSVFVLNETGANTNLTLVNAIALNSATRTINVNTTASGAEATISGVISNGSVTAGLTKGGAGTLILANTNTYTGVTTASAGALHITGGYSGSGRLVVNGGSLTVNMGDGIASFNGDAYGNSPLIGDGNFVGTLTLTSGTINVNTNSASASIRLGCNGGSANGTINVNGGIMNVPGRILMGANTAGSQATLTLGGGLLNLGKPGSYTTAGDPGCGVLWFGAFKSTVNLNSGTLALFGIRNTTTATAGSAFNFNGGILKAVANNNTDFLNLPSGMSAVVKSGGARIDTAGFDTSIGPSLLHDASLGALADGGLTKLGAGVLTLKGAGSYNGITTISNGTLRLGVANAITNSGAVVVAGGTYDLGGFIVTNGAVSLSSGSIVNGSLNASSFTLSDSGILQANLAGGTLTKAGSGTAILYGGNSYTGLTSVTQGTLTLAKLGLANCRLRLDASDITTLAANSDGTGAITGTGQQVGYWRDLSGNNKPATQATTSRRPTYITNVAEFNGLPVLQFDGSDDDITSLLDINATNIPNMTVIMIFRQVTYKLNGGLWGHDDGGWDRIQLLNFQSLGANNIAGSGNSILVKGMHTNAVLIYTASLKNGAANGSYVYINGVSDANTGLPAFTSNEGTGLASLTLGAIAPGSYRGNIQIGEVQVFDTVLSDPARRNVETYLKNKWLGASDPLTPFIPTNGAVQVASGAVLNLDGASHTVASISGEGVLSNGSLIVTGAISPAGESIGTLKVANVALNGTLRVNVAMDGSSDQLVGTGNLDLTGLTLQIADTELLNWLKRYTIVTCAGTLTGELTATLPKNWKIYYDRTAGTATLVYIPPGTMVRFM